MSLLAQPSAEDGRVQEGRNGLGCFSTATWSRTAACRREFTEDHREELEAVRQKGGVAPLSCNSFEVNITVGFD